MKNLKVWQKLSLLGVILLIPFAVVMVEWVSSVRTNSLQPARLELQGLEYIVPLRKLTREIQVHGVLSQAATSGDASVRQRVAAHSETIEQLMGAMDETDQRLNAILKTTKAWDAVQANCRALLNSSASLSSAESLRQFSAVNSQLVLLIHHVADTSKLTLDPEIASYHLMNAIIYGQSELARALAQSHTLSSGTSQGGPGLADVRLLTERENGVIAYLLGAIEHSLKDVRDAEKGLEDKISAAQGDNRVAVENYLRTHVSYAGARGRVTAGQYSSSATNAIIASYRLSDALTPALADLINRRIEGLNRQIRQTLLWTIVGLLVVCAIGAFIIRDVTRPLHTTVQLASQIAGGDLSAEVAAARRTDELGALLDTFGHMQVSLRAMTGNVSEAVNQLGSSSSQILASMSALSASSAETAAAVSETTTTVEEVRQTAHVSNDKAQIVAQSAQHVAQTAQEGKEAAEHSTQGMERIHGQMDAIAQSMIRLSEQSAAISEIIASVEDLTQQSNLLAVNAAIEAAKAGEQGKGFGVVAQEVKNLAEQSRQATGQVRTLLGDIQKATAAAVLATEQGTRVVEEGVAQSNLAGDAIVRLTESIDTAAQASIQIAASSQQQLIGVDQVAIAMDNVRQASLQNVDSVQQLEIAARDLNELGMRLKDMIAKYKL